MFDDLLLHPKTRTQLQSLVSRQPHGLLITGPDGSGKQTVAQGMAAQLLGVDVGNLENHAYFLHIDPPDNTISIDEVRSLQQFLKLKVPSTRQGIQRIVLLSHANRMRAEAQNALLKTLEEPPADTCIILTTTSADTLLPTISSRVSELVVLPVGQQAALDYFGQRGKKTADIAKYYILSQGQAGLLYSLLLDQAHPLKDKVELAKHVLSEPVSKRLLRTDELSKDKQQVALLLNALTRIAHAALVNSAKQQKNSVVQQWHSRQASIIESSYMLTHNPNIKLLLDNLFLDI